MVVEKINAIISKERVAELMPFLRVLTKEEKKELSLHLKKLSKEYVEYAQFVDSWRQKGTPTQINMVYAIAFVCLNRKEYQKFDGFAGILNNPFLNELLSLHCPDWFSDYINDLTKREWLPWHFDYSTALGMEEKSYVILSDELVARLIPQLIFERNESHKYKYAPKNLEKRKVTLEKHIWLIFQFETPINHSDRYLHFENSGKEKGFWIKSFKALASEGLLDRNRIMKESLLATVRNFNKTLSGWFVDLFEAMEPPTTELLAIQAELLNTLNSRHSRAVNSALQAIKNICDEKGFDSRGFLDHAPVLLSSETKSIVSATLALFEKLARKHHSFREELCTTACHALIHQDDQLQGRVCKLLLKYKDSVSSSLLTDEISKYADSTLMSTKNVLSDLITDSQAVGHVLEPTHESIPSPTTNDKLFKAVHEPASLDELIFLSSQAFDNNDIVHIDLLPAALVNMQDQLTGAVLPKFEAALQRAYSTVTGDWRSTMGYLDHLLATFFLEVMSVLVERFPDEGASLNGIRDAFKRKDEENKARFSGYTSRIPKLYTWSVHSRDNTYVIHKTILYQAYERIKNRTRLPLLSTPTHEHGYLDPLILVERLAHYQSNNALADLYDFQLAVSRVAPFNHTLALHEAQHKLSGEFLNIIQFLLAKDQRPVPPFTAEAVWFTAGVTRSPQTIYPEFSKFHYHTVPRTIFTGDVPWSPFAEKFTVKRYNFQTKRNEEIPSQDKGMRVTLPPTPTIWQESETPKSVLSRVLGAISGEKKQARIQPYALHECLSLKAQWISAENNDVQRFIGMFPSNPNPLLALIASRCLTHSTLSSEMDKKMLTNTLESLVGLKFHWSQMTHVFIASCLLTNDKTVRSFAAEIWIKGVTSGSAESDQIGRIIGILFTGEYAPMKRFTDTISENFWKISVIHNSALESMMTAVIENLPAEPRVGTKRLLEVYAEILLMNGSTVSSDNLSKKLLEWRSVSGLRNVLSAVKPVP